jgi:putative addiction module component (TIGR02574 family)
MKPVEKSIGLDYFMAMSLTEIMAELPALSITERQLLIRQALDLDDLSLPAEDEAEVERRLDGHRRNPNSTLSLDAMKARLRRLSK